MFKKLNLENGAKLDMKLNRELNLDMKRAVPDGTNPPISAPLTLEVTTPTLGGETLEEQREKKPKTRLHTGKKPESTRGLGTKAKVVTLKPDQVFTDNKQVRENTRDTDKLIRVETEKDMTNIDGRSQWRSQEQKGLNPIDTTFSQGTRKEEVLKRFQMITTKARRFDVVAKGD